MWVVYNPRLDSGCGGPTSIPCTVQYIFSYVIDSPPCIFVAHCRIDQAVRDSEFTSMEKLIQVLVMGTENIEQRLEKGSINILTMHQAKGLTAEAVIVAAAEGQYIPGKNKIDDERRLLYVSLTRAKHYLYITYCDKRTGQQRHTGNSAGKLYRSLTQFLSDCPHTPRNGRGFIDCLTGKKS